MGEGREGGFNSSKGLRQLVQWLALKLSLWNGRSAPGDIGMLTLQFRQEDSQGVHKLLVHPQTLG